MNCFNVGATDFEVLGQWTAPQEVHSENKSNAKKGVLNEGRGGSGGLENKVDSRDPWRKIKVAKIFSVKKQSSLELSWKECEGQARLRIIKSNVLIRIVLFRIQRSWKSNFGPLGIFPELTGGDWFMFKVNSSDSIVLHLFFNLYSFLSPFT